MTRKLQKEIRVDSLLMAAVDEFLDKGYNGASMDAIARRAGVSKGGLYHHFANKEILLMYANQKLSEPAMLLMEKALSNPSPLQGLRDFIFGYLTYWATRPRELSFFFLSMSKALESPCLMEYYREYVKESVAFFIEMFERTNKEGKIKIDDPKAYGISLMGGLDGLASFAIIHPEEDIKLLADRFEHVWLRQGKE